MHFRNPLFSLVAIVSLASAMAACGGGGGGGGGGDSGGSTGGTGGGSTLTCSGSGTVALNGTITFDRVPDVADGTGGARLLHDQTFQSPARQVQVQARCPDGSSTYATAVTEEDGSYAIEVPENVDVQLRVLAIMQKTGDPSWDLRVLDNTSGNATYAMVGEAFNSETGSLTVNLNADSGWTSSLYGNTRSAAPFAILDSIYTAMQKVMVADPLIDFPTLQIFWAANNRSCTGTISSGCIGTTFYSNGSIYVLGNESDTDEYDEHVMVHEWAHYFEDFLARSDSIGGRHSGGNRLDPRVAFGEGWGNAWSGIGLDDPIYKDTNSGAGFTLGLESASDSSFPVVSPDQKGWFSEDSVQRIIYDLYDNVSDAEDSDTVSLGFTPLYDVLTDEQRLTPYFTTIFSFLHALKTNNGSEAASIDVLASAFRIDPVADARGTGETNDSSNTDNDLVLPVYTEIVVDGAAVEICSSNLFRTSDGAGGYDEYNRLGARRFLYLEQTTPANLRFTIQGSAISGSNPELKFFDRGELVSRTTSGGSSKLLDASVDGSPVPYALELLDQVNTNDASDGGKSCINVSVSSN